MEVRSAAAAAAAAVAPPPPPLAASSNFSRTTTAGAAEARGEAEDTGRAGEDRRRPLPCGVGGGRSCCSTMSAHCLHLPAASSLFSICPHHSPILLLTLFLTSPRPSFPSSVHAAGGEAPVGGGAQGRGWGVAVGLLCGDGGHVLPVSSQQHHRGGGASPALLRPPFLLLLLLLSLLERCSAEVL